VSRAFYETQLSVTLAARSTPRSNFHRGANAQIYHQFAEMFASFQDSASLEIAGVLWDMAIEERHHSSLLQRHYTAKYGQGACALTETDILEIIELPQLDNAESLNLRPKQ